MYTIILPIKLFGDPSCMIKTSGFNLFLNIGLPSYEKFLHLSNLESFILICPDSEVEKLKLSIYRSKIPFLVYPESAFLDKGFRDKNYRGWYVQQVLKLCVNEIVKTPLYLVLDSDHFLTQPFSETDLYEKGKIKMSTEPWQTQNNEFYSTNSNWWQSSCNLLNYSIQNLYDKELMGVTPQILITEEVKNLCKYLEKYSDWKNYICEKTFTEFTLYWIYILIMKKENLYTNQGKLLWKHNLDCNVLTYNCNETKVKNAFTNKECFFSVIQSYLVNDISNFVQEFQRCLNPVMEYNAIFLISAMTIPNRYQGFSIEERVAQTIETVQSAKRKVPNSFCILIEGGVILESFRDLYMKAFDKVLEFADNKEVQNYVNHPHNIGHGEMKLLEKGIDYLEKEILPVATCKRIFKLGARYSLNDNFSLENFSTEQYTFKKRFDESIQGGVFITGLYCIPPHLLNSFKNFLIKSQTQLSIVFTMIEKMFYDGFPDSHTVETLGLQGALSYNKYFFTE